ncbi:DUF4405 domain-containing protein [Candidatus Woesearchaeota archaeon]|nr:DUF4405 domain-containing protein [Candidatus Woesearchaeota archaeon]
MDKTKLNYLIDALLAVSFIVTALTGLALFFFMPSGIPQGRYQAFLGISKTVWLAAHDLAGIIMILLSLIHLVLHWKWVVCMTRSFLKRKEN